MPNGTTAQRKTGRGASPERMRELTRQRLAKRPPARPGAELSAAGAAPAVIVRPDRPDIVTFVQDTLDLTLSPAQRTLLKAIYGVQLTAEELEIFLACTGRSRYPGIPFGEITAICGAQSGKSSMIAAPIVTYEAVHADASRLGRGLRPTIPCVAMDQRGAGIVFDCVKTYLETRGVSRFVDSVLKSKIRMVSGLTIEVYPNVAKALRGWSIPSAAVLDELGFFKLTETSPDSDVEVQQSIKRGMLHHPGPLVKISTAYAKSGVLWADFKRSYGQDDADLLVWRASTKIMFPATDDAKLAKAKRSDPALFAREYLGEFAEDLAALLTSAQIDQAIQTGVTQIPPEAGVKYVAAVDMNQGGRDASSLAIVRVDGVGEARRVTQVFGRAWVKPYDRVQVMEEVVGDIARIVRAYGLDTVTGDRASLNLIIEAFERAKITYKHPLFKDLASDRGEAVYFDKSRVYREIVPLFADGLIDILDDAETIRELRMLERATRSGGVDRVDHPRNQHDDRANALALAAVAALAGARRTKSAGFVTVITRPLSNDVRRALALARDGIRAFRDDDAAWERALPHGFAGNTSSRRDFAVHPHERF